MSSKPFLVLASQSPRRKILLTREGYTFDIIPSQAEEKDATAENVTEIVQENARIKGEEVVQQLAARKASYQAPTVVLAADTLVAMDQRVFPKPKDMEQAHEFLATLGGKQHQVMTGVFLHHLQSGKSVTFCDTTQVTLKKMDRDARERLFERMYPLDKAGAYGSQDAPDIIESLDGHLSTVIGLPIERLPDQLERLLH